MRNLWAAGSTVFPTGGYANQTLTVVALAVRLAEHLHGHLGAPAVGRAPSSGEDAPGRSWSLVLQP